MASSGLTKPEVIVSSKKSQKIVANLLMTDLSMPVVGIVFKTNNLTGNISLIVMYSPTFRRPVVFDVYRNPKLYMEGQLHRIFQADRLVKVVHDCKNYCAQLKREHYIKCSAMFDSQVAYTLKMEENGMPPRLIEYENLHRNIVGMEIGKLYSYMKASEKSDGNIWNKRPLSAEMLFALGEEVISIRSEVYPRVLSALDEYGLDEFETRCALAARGSRLTGNMVTTPRKSTRTLRAPFLTINSRQAELLPNTKPLASEWRIK